MFKSNRDYKLYIDDIVLWDTLGNDFDEFEKVIKEIADSF
jgi:hypothetical protein